MCQRIPRCILTQSFKEFSKLDYMIKDLKRNWHLVILIFVFCFVPLASGHKLRLRKIDDCKASLGGQVINLEPLARLDGRPRFEVVYQGWHYSYNPCISYNLPLNPHDGKGDGCHYVTMCKWQQSGQDPGQYFTVGIERTTKFLIRRPGETVHHEPEDIASLESSESSSEQNNETSSEESSSEQTIYDNKNPPNFKNVSLILQALSSKNATLDVSRNASLYLNYTHEESTNGSHVQKRSIDIPTNIQLYEHLKKTLQRTVVGREKRQTSGDENIEKDSEDGEEEAKDEDEELEEEDAEIDEDENLTTEDLDLVMKLRGIRRMKHQRSLIYLVCDRKRSTVEDALFLLREFEQKDIIFELHHKCCCPGVCELGLDNAANNTDNDNLSATDKRFKELEENGPKLLWLVLVVNAAIILVAILIGTTFCRKGGSGPYNMLPIALNSSRFTLNSLESFKTPLGRPFVARTPKPAPRAPEYLEYTSSLLKLHQTPLLNDVVISAKDLEIGQRLGGGLFGDTYLGIWDERTVAVKRITIGVHQKQIQEDKIEWMRKEATFLSRQRHKNIVSMIGICFDLRQPHIINEYVEGQSLKDLLIKEGETISMVRRVKMMQQAVEGLQFLHTVKARTILHRDLRCANLLVYGQDKIKIADFGVIRLTQKLREECTGRKGCYCQKDSSGLPASVRWTAPELLDNPDAAEGPLSAVTTACDVFSFAMVLWEVATAEDPFSSVQSEDEVQEVIVNGGRPDVDELYIVPHYRELMIICWEQEPENRPSFKQISNHLKNVHSNTVKMSVRVDKTARSVDSVTTSYLRSALNLT